MTRFLGIDYGEKRIGLAVGDSSVVVASPVATLLARGSAAENARAVVQNSRGFDIDACVVGLPLNMDGTEGEQAKKTRLFGAELAQAIRKPIYYWDERLSTVEARDLLSSAELTYKKKKKRVDRVAAQMILQEFLVSNQATPQAPTQAATGTGTGEQAQPGDQRTPSE